MVDLIHVVFHCHTTLLYIPEQTYLVLKSVCNNTDGTTQTGTGLRNNDWIYCLEYDSACNRTIVGQGKINESAFKIRNKDFNLGVNIGVFLYQDHAAFFLVLILCIRREYSIFQTSIRLLVDTIPLLE